MQTMRLCSSKWKRCEKVSTRLAATRCESRKRTVKARAVQQPSSSPPIVPRPLRWLFPPARSAPNQLLHGPDGEECRCHIDQAAVADERLAKSNHDGCDTARRALHRHRRQTSDADGVVQRLLVLRPHGRHLQRTARQSPVARLGGHIVRLRLPLRPCFRLNAMSSPVSGRGAILQRPSQRPRHVWLVVEHRQLLLTRTQHPWA